MTICNLCNDKIGNSSYFIRYGEGMNASLIEVCPECHHIMTYGTDQIKENYKNRRNIK